MRLFPALTQKIVLLFKTFGMFSNHLNKVTFHFHSRETKQLFRGTHKHFKSNADCKRKLKGFCKMQRHNPHLVNL